MVDFPVFDAEALLAAFRSFNRWLQEDWGFNHEDRIYAAPYIPLVDVDWAVEELEGALDHNVGAVLMRPGSVYGAARRRTPGDPAHDAFWNRLNEAGVTLMIHGGESGYAAYERIWDSRARPSHSASTRSSACSPPVRSET